MKLIMENFRKFVLKERKSDEVYIKTAQFIVDIMTLENFRSYHLEPETVPFDEAKKPFDVKKFIKDLEDEYTPLQRKFFLVNKKNPENLTHDNYYFQIKSSKLKKMWEQHNETVKSNIIFDSYETFKEYMGRMRIYATYASDPGKMAADASMDSNGNMFFYLGDKVDLKTPEKILSYIKSIAYDTIIHEGTHWLNAIRASGESLRAAGGKKVHDAISGKLGRDAEKKAYHDSTEELQARIISAFNDFNRASWEDPSKEEVYVKLSSKDLQGAIIQFLDTFYYEALSRRDWNQHNEDYKQKLFGRVYQFIQKAAKSEDFKKWANQAEEKGIIIPRSGTS